MSDAPGRRQEHQTPPRSSWVRLLLATGLLFVLLPCLGLLGGAVYLRMRQAGAFSHWRSLGAPPQVAVELVTGDTSVVYVRTVRGDVYECRHHEAAAARDCWETAQGPVTVDAEVRFDQPVYEGEVQPPAGKVVDRLYTARWYAEDAFETRYVLLDDSTVWKWEYDVGGNWSLLILVVGLLAGIALAVAATSVIWAPVVLLRSLPRKRR